MINSDNDLVSNNHQTNIWTIAGILLIGHLPTQFSENRINIQQFSNKKTNLTILSAKSRPFCFDLQCVTATDVNVPTPGPQQNGRHFADDIFECISLKENIFAFKLHWNLHLHFLIFYYCFLLVQMRAYCCQATNHFLNQSCHSLRSH